MLINNYKMVCGPRDIKPTSAVEKLCKYILSRKEFWAGTEQEYLAWGTKTLRQGITNLAQDSFLISNKPAGE